MSILPVVDSNGRTEALTSIQYDGVKVSSLPQRQQLEDDGVPMHNQAGKRRKSIPNGETRRLAGSECGRRCQLDYRIGRLQQ
jgi:hypothetical protein